MRRTRSATRALIGALAWTVAAPALMAEPMQCGSKIVDVGMTMDEVRRYCGEPTRQESEQQDVRSGNQVVGTTTFTRWYYMRAGATRVMVFDQHKLLEID